MKRSNYEAPQIEVVEIEIEASVLIGSGDANGLPDITGSNPAW